MDEERVCVEEVTTFEWIFEMEFPLADAVVDCTFQPKIGIARTGTVDITRVLVTTCKTSESGGAVTIVLGDR